MAQTRHATRSTSKVPVTIPDSKSKSGVPTIDALNLRRAQMIELHQKIVRQWEVAQEASLLKKEKEVLDAEITSLLKLAGETQVIDPTAQLRVNTWTGASVTITKERLLEQGVSPTAIAAATKRTEYPVVRVDAIVGEGGK